MSQSKEPDLSTLMHKPKQQSASRLKEHSSERQSVSSKYNSLTTWWLEILAAIFSVACIGVNVGFLSAIDGKPYQSWRISNVEITPNTIVSIVSTLSKTSLLLPVAEGISQLKWTYFQQRPHHLCHLQTFDDASRGPLGALKLLWQLRLQALVASIGAFLTILCLALDPFTQQILTYPSRLTPAPNMTATIGAARGLVDTASILEKSTNKPNMLNVMTSTIFNNPVEAAYSCSSGNCQWPPYESFGLCSMCEDISHQTKITCDPIVDMEVNRTGFMCTYRLPEEDRFWSAWAKYEGVFYPTTFLNISVLWPPWFVIGSNKYEELVSFVSMRLNQQYTTSPADVVPQMSFCKLKWCVKEFPSTRVNGGKLEDAPPPAPSLALNMSSCPVQGAYTTTCSVHAVPGIGETISLTSRKTYKFNDTDMKNVWSNFMDTFYASVWLNPSIVTSIKDSALRNGSLIPARALRELDLYSRQPNQDASPTIQTLYYTESGNISKIIHNITTSVTNALRNGPAGGTVSGTVELLVAHVHVDWPWLTFPAALSVLAALFLATSIAFSAERDKLVWKASVLPLLFHGPRGWDDGGHPIGTELEQMQKQSDRMLAQLTKDENKGVSLQVWR